MRCLNTLIYVAKNKIVSSQALHLPQLFLETIKLLGKKKRPRYNSFSCSVPCVIRLCEYS